MLKMIILPRQARDKHSRETQKRDAFFRRLEMNGTKGSDSDTLQPNVLDSYVDDHSSVRGAARLLFTVPTCGVCVYDPVYACYACYGCRCRCRCLPWLALLYFCTRSVPFLSFLLSSFSFSFPYGLTQQRRVSGEGCIRDRDVSLSVLVRKTHLLRHLMLKMIILPRQARDKHSRETQKRDAFFSQARDERHEGLRQRHPPAKRPGRLR